MIPPLYADVMQRIRTYHTKEIDKARERYEREHKRHVARLADEQEHLTKAVATFLELGVFMPQTCAWGEIATDGRGGRSRSHEHPITIVRDMARELKRPFVEVYNDYVQIPRVKRLQVLTLPFVLVVKDGYPGVHHRWKTTYVPIEPSSPVIRDKMYRTIDRYHFIGETGKQFREAFLEHLKTPECRKALKLT